MEIEPLRIKHGALDLSNFYKFVVPNRRLTPKEQAVYRQLATEWAELDGRAQLALYAMLLDGRLADRLSAIVVNTARSMYTREDETTHPRVQEVARRVNTIAIEEHTKHLLGYYHIAGQRFAHVLSEPIMAPPPPTNFWQRVLAGSDG